VCFLPRSEGVPVGGGSGRSSCSAAVGGDLLQARGRVTPTGTEILSPYVWDVPRPFEAVGKPPAPLCTHVDGALEGPPEWPIILRVSREDIEAGGESFAAGCATPLRPRPDGAW